MKFLCNVRWDDGSRNFVSEKVYDLSEMDIKKYSSMKCRDANGSNSAMGVMVRFSPMDESAKSAIEKLLEIKPEEDEELKRLREEAKALNIKGFHLMGKDKLIDAIAKAKE